MRWLVLVLLPSLAFAEVSVDLDAADPVANLPVISADRLNFLRPFRRWRKGCKKPDIYVEDGGIDASVVEPQYSTTQLVGGCGEAVDAFAGNVGAVNASMSSTKCSRAAKRAVITEKLPAHFEAEGMQIDITANATSAHVTVNRLNMQVGAWVGGRRMSIPMAVQEVHGWYVVETAGTRQLAVLLSGRESDGTIAERWMEVWATKASAKPQTIDVARTWVLAVAMQDAEALLRVSAAPFERVGLGAKDCARTATKASELPAFLGCSFADPARYVGLFDEQEFAKLRSTPAPLAGQAKLLARLAKKGATLVLFSGEDEAGTVELVIAVKNGKVIGAVGAEGVRHK